MKRARAKRLLVHYFETVFRRAGAGWDADNVAEVEELADALIDAAVEQMHDELEQQEHRR